VSPVSVLQGRLCGLCGNNNYDLGDDMTTFDGKLTNSRSFVLDNVMPSEYCDVSDYSTQLGLRHEGVLCVSTWRHTKCIQQEVLEFKRLL